MPTDPTPAPPTDAERLRAIAREFCRKKAWRLSDVDGREFLDIADRLEALEARNPTLERLAAAAGEPGNFHVLKWAVDRMERNYNRSGFPNGPSLDRLVAEFRAFLAVLKEAAQP